MAPDDDDVAPDDDDVAPDDDDAVDDDDSGAEGPQPIDSTRRSALPASDWNRCDCADSAGWSLLPLALPGLLLRRRRWPSAGPGIPRTLDRSAG